ncbi:uncharacterized protein LOC115877657 [Sitophilus oryzae]|uniref:Uncharacterized protein LOC115877657 n=1 Tax=Sitophilus oryzae TaxID=7048 RepID=A0A6J2XGD3_SITOR|nr:uncharacterized protein LOC115877657 [Sitophilus oryzae]
MVPWIVLVTVVLVVVALDSVQPAAVQYYASKYEHIDVESILNNRRMVNYYTACLLSKGPCPPEGVDLKRILPEALQTNCARCTEKQRTVALRAIKRLQKEYPKVWNDLSKQWDPDDIYVKRFQRTFAEGSNSEKPSHSVASSVDNRFPSPDDHQTDNTIDGTFSPVSSIASTTSTAQKPPTSSIKDASLLPSSVSTEKSTTTFKSTTTNLPSPSPSTPPPSNPSSISSSTYTTSEREPPEFIPGLVPLNTFFTNPPIPIRPIANINSNIQATVKAIKKVERLVTEIAMEKLNLVKNVFTRPWRRIRKFT